MTPEQVFGFLKRKMNLNPKSAEFLEPLWSHIVKLKDEGCSFKCEDDKLIAIKDDYTYTLSMGNVKNYIETYFDEETGNFKGYFDKDNNFISIRDKEEVK